ncbi:MAG: 1-acyl-sn-glycerol-3-phosphate acyltransferase [Bacteroidia bacterium]
MESVNEDLSFDAIRPFYDQEVAPAMQRLLSEKSFYTALNYIFPEVPEEELIKKLNQIHSIQQFQKEIIAPAVYSVVESSTKGLSISGLENLNREKAYLLISNHRDIVLDSAFLNVKLFSNDFPTTRIAIGSNLLQRPWIEDLVRMNKNFIVHRDVHSRQAYIYSMRLSGYIRHSLLNENTSVWIAQKEGRTKDGNDRTQAGLLKMFGMNSETEDMVEAYHSLNIAPVSLSYEIEPCGGMKAYEKYITSLKGEYQKAPAEDLISMQNGISKQKGRVHFEFSAPLNKSQIEEAFSSGKKNESVKNLAEIIDQVIISNYKLFPFNFVAYDMLNKTNRFIDQYSDENINQFNRVCKSELMEYGAEAEAILPYLLNIYANPVLNKIKRDLI